MKSKLREDLQCRELAVELGYSIEMHINDKSSKADIFYKDRSKCPQYSLSFKKGNKTIWLCSKGWACADLTGNGTSESIQYRNHRYRSSLKETLEIEAA